MGEESTTFAQGAIRIDWRRRSVWVNGAQVAFGDRGLDLLAALLARRGEVLGKDELMQAAWPGLVVTDGNLHVQMNALRRLLGPEAIVNVRGRGYKLVLRPDAPAGEVLIGRDADVRTITARLKEPGRRWITLHGPGGVGKTRVADAVLEASAADFDTCRRIELAPLREAARVPDALLQAFGLQPLGALDPLPLLATHLQGRRVLLMLDNLEQLRDCGPWLQRLLDAAPGLTLLATSRALLQQPHETAAEIRPLAGPRRDQAPEAALQSPAMQLFVERARALGHDPSVEPAELRAAVEICARLDGLPLALDLAAARLRVLSARQLREQLGRLPQWLGAGADAPGHRQRSLDDTLQWSLDLLPAGAAGTLARLAVCAGGFDAETARAIGGAPDLATTLDRVAVLLDHHLLQRRDDEAGHVRYGMLEPVRHAALARLAPAVTLGAIDAAQAAGAAHAAHFTRLAAEGDRALRSRERSAWLPRLQAERDNFRAALHHLMHEKRDARGALTLAGHLAWWWYFAGALAEGREWLTAALALPATSGAEEDRLRAQALSGQAKMALYLGDFGAAIDLATRAVELARAADAPAVQAYALYHLAIPTQVRSPPAALALYDEAQALFARLGDAWGEALATIYGGIPLAFAPEHAAAARERLLDGRRRFEALGDDWGASVADQYLDLMALRRGDLEAAARHAKVTLDVATALNDGFRIASAHHQQGRIALAGGRHEEADAAFLRSTEAHMAQGRFGYATQMLNHAARAALRRGDLRRAATLLGAAAVDRGPLIMPVFLPDELAGFRTLREQVQERLGAEAFAAAERDGARLTLAQAAQLARGEPPR